MLRRLAILTAVLSGFYLTASVLDRMNWLESLWAGITPRIVLERTPTPMEKHRMGLQRRIDAACGGVEDLTRSIRDGESKLADLRRQLAEQLDGQAIPANRTAEYVREHPIIAVLVRSADGQQEELRKAKLTLAFARKDLADLEARKMALDNGVSMIEPESRPSDALEAEDSAHCTVQERYADILRQSSAVADTENEWE